jgi:hypothetical protein
MDMMLVLCVLHLYHGYDVCFTEMLVRHWLVVLGKFKVEENKR